MTWWIIGAMVVGAYAFKFGGLVALSRIELQGPMAHLVRFLPPALFASLIVQQTITTGSAEVIATRALGVAAGGVAVWRKAPLLVVIVVGAGVAALARTLI